MWGLGFDPRYARLYCGKGSKDFLMNRGWVYAQGDQITVHVAEERGRSANIKVSSSRNAEFLQRRYAPVPLQVEVASELVGRVGLAIRNRRPAARDRGQQLPSFLRENMFPGIACGIDPPDFPGFRATGCESMQHRKNRGDADSGAQQNDWPCTWA